MFRKRADSLKSYYLCCYLNTSRAAQQVRDQKIHAGPQIKTQVAFKVERVTYGTAKNNRRERCLLTYSLISLFTQINIYFCLFTSQFFTIVYLFLYLRIHLLMTLLIYLLIHFTYQFIYLFIYFLISLFTYSLFMYLVIHLFASLFTYCGYLLIHYKRICLLYRFVSSLVN